MRNHCVTFEPVFPFECKFAIIAPKKGELGNKAIPHACRLKFCGYKISVFKTLSETQPCSKGSSNIIFPDILTLIII